MGVIDLERDETRRNTSSLSVPITILSVFTKSYRNELSRKNSGLKQNSTLGYFLMYFTVVPGVTVDLIMIILSDPKASLAILATISSTIDMSIPDSSAIVGVGRPMKIYSEFATTDSKLSVFLYLSYIWTFALEKP